MGDFNRKKKKTTLEKYSAFKSESLLFVIHFQITYILPKLLWVHIKLKN